MTVCVAELVDWIKKHLSGASSYHRLATYLLCSLNSSSCHLVRLLYELLAEEFVGHKHSEICGLLKKNLCANQVLVSLQSSVWFVLTRKLSLLGHFKTLP